MSTPLPNLPRSGQDMALGFANPFVLQMPDYGKAIAEQLKAKAAEDKQRQAALAKGLGEIRAPEIQGDNQFLASTTSAAAKIVSDIQSNAARNPYYRDALRVRGGYTPQYTRQEDYAALDQEARKLNDQLSLLNLIDQSARNTLNTRDQANRFYGGNEDDTRVFMDLYTEYVQGSRFNEFVDAEDYKSASFELARLDPKNFFTTRGSLLSDINKDKAQGVLDQLIQRDYLKDTMYYTVWERDASKPQEEIEGLNLSFKNEVTGEAIAPVRSYADLVAYAFLLNRNKQSRYGFSGDAKGYEDYVNTTRKIIDLNENRRNRRVPSSSAIRRQESTRLTSLAIISKQNLGDVAVASGFDSSSHIFPYTDSDDVLSPTGDGAFSRRRLGSLVNVRGAKAQPVQVVWWRETDGTIRRGLEVIVRIAPPSVDGVPLADDPSRDSSGGYNPDTMAGRTQEYAVIIPEGEDGFYTPNPSLNDQYYVIADTYDAEARRRLSAGQSTASAPVRPTTGNTQPRTPASTNQSAGNPYSTFKKNK